MQQYLDLLRTIKEKGVYKPAAREGMPGTQSLFGYQFRHDLGEGFPLLTTKKVSWKNVVTELLWFLRGDTNIKYLLDNDCNIWNEDAFNYYEKICEEQGYKPFYYEKFIKIIKDGYINPLGKGFDNYILGDCGFQYGKVWRTWEAPDLGEFGYDLNKVDQIANVIKGLKKAPESRRHIVTAIDPAHDTELALYWCHAMFQFNCRPLTSFQRLKYYNENFGILNIDGSGELNIDKNLDSRGIPKYYLDCQLYQRSADVVLGVPFNIASYALLTHIIAKIVNMIPGDFIHTFGDVHIYDNHKEAVEEQLSREPRTLPTLKLGQFGLNIDEVKAWDLSDFSLEGYNPHPPIKAELSTGLKK